MSPSSARARDRRQLAAQPAAWRPDAQSRGPLARLPLSQARGLISRDERSFRRRRLGEGRAAAAGRPAAARQRLADVVGQDHLLNPEGPLGRMVAAGRPPSIILWGPPGTGKTTIARLLSTAFKLHFEQLSAVFTGVADLKKTFEAARSAAARRAGHAALHRRDPPLQPQPAGLFPAGGGGRHHRAGRRHHRESVLRAERRAAVARPGAGAAPAGRCRAGNLAPARRSPLSASRCR